MTTQEKLLTFLKDVTCLARMKKGLVTGLVETDMSL